MENNLKASAKRIQDHLHHLGIETKVIEFKELTRTAEEAAKAIGCEVAQIAKTIIFKGKTTHKPIVVIASGKNRVDEKKIESKINEKVEKSDADFVLKHTSFAIGGVPPIGYALDIKPFLDEDLKAYDMLWAAAGTPNAVFCLTFDDLLKITQGQIIDLKK